MSWTSPNPIWEDVLPREIRTGRLEDLDLGLEALLVAALLCELRALVRCQSFDPAAIDVVDFHPPTQTRLTDPQDQRLCASHSTFLDLDLPLPSSQSALVVLPVNISRPPACLAQQNCQCRDNQCSNHERVHQKTGRDNYTDLDHDVNGPESQPEHASSENQSR